MVMFTLWVSPAARQLHHHLITSSASGTDETSQRVLMIGPLQRRTAQTTARDAARNTVELL